MPSPAPFQHSRRAVYRVVYPPHARPTFTTRGVACLVIDCSELGIRFEWTGGDVSEVGTTIQGVVSFRRGTEVEVTGEVIRSDALGVALWFGARGIPLAEILAERAYLASRDETPP